MPEYEPALHELEIEKVMKNVRYTGVVAGPTTKFFANKDKTAIVVEQFHQGCETQRVELTINMIEQLPRMANRWIKEGKVR